MFKTIILKELLDYLKGYKFVVVFLTCLILMGFNHAVMYQNYQSNLIDYSLKLPGGGMPIQKKPEPLSIYMTGANELMNRVFVFEDDTKDIKELHLINFDIYRQYFPLIDFNYLVRVILSFLAMIIGFDAICREKQYGTLKLLLSNSIARSAVLWGKIISSLFTLIIPFLASVLLYYIILSLKPNVHFTMSDNIRIFLVIIISIIYLSIFLIISITVSASSSTIKVSIIKNFIIWVAIIFILPNISSLFAESWDKLPDERKVYDSYLIKFQESRKQMTDSLASEKALFAYCSAVLDYRNKLKSNTRVLEIISFLVPSNAFNLCATSLTQCGLENEDNFRSSILSYYKQRFNSKTDINFTYTGLGLKASIENSLKYCFSLMMYVLVILVFAVYKFNHYDIR